MSANRSIPPTPPVDQPPPTGDVNHQLKFIRYTAWFLDSELQRYYAISKQLPRLEAGAIERIISQAIR